MHAQLSRAKIIHFALSRTESDNFKWINVLRLSADTVISYRIVLASSGELYGTDTRNTALGHHGLSSQL